MKKNRPISSNFVAISSYRLATYATAAAATALVGSKDVRAAGTDDPPGTPITVPNFFDAGSTVGFNNSITQPQAGSPFAYPGPDAFYTFSLTSDTALTFTLTPSSAYDAALFILTSPTDNTSIAISDNVGGGQVETISQTFAAGTYYVLIDSYYASGAASAGTYTLEVIGVPEPSTWSFLMGSLGVLAGFAWWKRGRQTVEAASATA